MSMIPDNTHTIKCGQICRAYEPTSRLNIDRNQALSFYKEKGQKLSISGYLSRKAKSKQVSREKKEADGQGIWKVERQEEKYREETLEQATKPSNQTVYIPVMTVINRPVFILKPSNHHHPPRIKHKHNITQTTIATKDHSSCLSQLSVNKFSTKSLISNENHVKRSEIQCGKKPSVLSLKIEKEKQEQEVEVEAEEDDNKKKKFRLAESLYQENQEVGSKRDSPIRHLDPGNTMRTYTFKEMRQPLSASSRQVESIEFITKRQHDISIGFDAINQTEDQS